MALEGRLKPAPDVLFFFAIATAKEDPHVGAQERLEAAFGPFGRCSSIYRFSDFSTYYDRELGGTTWKYFVALRELRPADRMVEVKLAAERIQAEFARRSPQGTQRTVNIDPGYVNGWQVTLATVKNQGHRIYLDRGVFIEVELLYRHGSFRPLPWTYQDYQSEPALSFLRETRADYMAMLRRPR
jgi:hypothetical protein